MSIEIYPSVAKAKRNGAWQNLPGFVQQSGNADIEAMIANKETSTTAQFPHAKDSFFILNDVLYQADENISVNGTIAVGTNCHVAVLGNVVSDLIGDVSSQSEEIEAIVNGESTETPDLGDINGSALVASTNRAIIVKELGTIATISVKSGLQFCPAVNNTGIGATITYLRAWGSEPYDVSNRTEKYLFVLVRKSDNSNLSDSDLNDAITFTYKESLRKLDNVVFGNNIPISHGTGSNGFYSGSVGSAIVTNSGDGGIYYSVIDLSAYIGKDVKISFTTTGYSSARISAICDSNGIIGSLQLEKYIYRDGFTIFHIDNTYKYLYVSHNTTASNLAINVIVNKGLVNVPPTTVYVSTTGNDSNSGSVYEPLATIQKAISTGAEIIKVEAGEYAGFEVVDRKTPLKIMLKDMPTTYDSDYAEARKIKITSGVSRDGAVYFENCPEIALEDIWVAVSDNSSFLFWNVFNLTVTRCFASGNSTAIQKDGFKFRSSNGKVYDCKAWNISKDGFNIAVYGNVDFINCDAHDCGDDGISHHDGCRGFVDGCEFYNCAKGGIATPCYGSEVTIQNCYCHDNKFGLYSWSDGVLPNSYGRVSNCVFKDNTDKDISIEYSDIVGWNNIYDTKVVGSHGTFTEIANS